MSVKASNDPAKSINGRPLVVVVEDEAVVLAGYQMLFESWDYSVVAAQDADEALDQLGIQTALPGFIVADFRLANGQTGMQAIERLRQAYGRSIPGVIVTGDTNVTAAGLRQAAAEGIQVLHKPVHGRQLKELLASVLERR